MRVEIIYIVWSFRGSLSYREFVMLGRSNRILMASYGKCGNKLSCTVVATEIEFAKT